MKRKELTLEERLKALKNYWIYFWVMFVFMVAFIEFGTNFRLEGNPYKGHVKLAGLFILIAVAYFGTFYASRKSKCPVCDGNYFGSKVFNTLKPHKGCEQCGE